MRKKQESLQQELLSEQQELKFLQAKMRKNYMQTAQQPFYVQNPAL